MPTASKIDMICEKMIDCYKRVYGDSIREIILYGSYARGDFDDESDIDFVAIVEGERLPLQKKLKKVWAEAAELGTDYDVMVSPTMIPLGEYERYRTILPYYGNIQKEGIKLE